MTTALLLTTLLAFGGPASARGNSKARLLTAQTEFNQGNFQAALKTLDLALDEASDDATLARIQLLRGQAFGAMRDLVQAEEALAAALEHDPEATLDPNRVDPSLVSMLSGLKGRMEGPIEVVTEKPGAKVAFDGKLLGSTPVKAKVNIGRHKLDVRSADGKSGATEEVVIYPKRENRFEVAMTELPQEQGTREEAGGGPVFFGFGKPFADIRLQFDPFQYAEGVGIEVGGGLMSTYLRASVSLRVFPEFGLTPRGAFTVPVAEHLKAYVELELPVIFYYGPDWLGLGLGGQGGADYEFNKWLVAFGQVGARHFFITPREPNRLTLQAGIRLKMP